MRSNSISDVPGGNLRENVFLILLRVSENGSLFVGAICWWSTVMIRIEWSVQRLAGASTVEAPWPTQAISWGLDRAPDIRMSLIACKCTRQQAFKTLTADFDWQLVNQNQRLVTDALSAEVYIKRLRSSCCLFCLGEGNQWSPTSNLLLKSLIKFPPAAPLKIKWKLCLLEKHFQLQ